jgi:hypothetical protein
MRFYDTQSAGLEPLQPSGGSVSLYVCGITPAVLCQNRRLASPCRAAEGKRYQQEADELNPRHDGFHVHC